MTAFTKFDGAALAVITATLIGSDIASAEGLYGTGPSPVLALCRKLIASGFDPALPLIAMRDQTVCLRIRSVGEASRLAVTSYGVGFERYRPGPQDRSSSPPIAANAPARTRQRARRKAA